LRPSISMRQPLTIRIGGNDPGAGKDWIEILHRSKALP
jgi:hypothetical protein